MKLFKLFLPVILLIISFKVNASNNASAQASYIYNFIRYIKWPANSVSENFIIGVYGESAVYDELVALSNNRKVGTQKILVKKVSENDAACQCQLLFVPASKKHLVKEISMKIGNKPVLLITEESNSSDCNIEFVYPDDKLHFKVNEEKAKNQKLYMSQSLINLAYKI